MIIDIGGNMKKLIIFVIIFSMATVGTMYATGQNDDDETLNYGGQYYPDEILLKGYDFFGESDVLVNHILFSSGTESNEALISGSIDVNVGSDSKTVALFSAMGEDALIIGTVQKGNRYSTMIKSGANYSDWSDLKGMTVGTRFGSGAEFVLRKYFDSREDLNWEDYNWVNLKVEDMIATLDNGQIEAFTVWAPTSEVAEAQGIATLLRNYGDVALTPVSLHTTRTYADKNRDKLVRFLAAHINKQNMIKNNPEQAADISAKIASELNMDMSAEAFEIIFDRIDFTVNCDPTLADELTSTAQFLYDQGQIKKIPEFYFDPTILEDAIKLVNE
jgi:ABC-type nitrate/sulfonate/bicarbonate transport system substrate-binding protein